MNIFNIQKNNLNLFLKRDLIIIGLISILTVFAWGFLTKLYLWGDGMIYFIEFPGWWNGPKTVTTLMSNFELGSIAIAGLLGSVFGAHFSWYFWFELATMLAINVLFYYMVFSLTKHRLVSFMATVFLAANYFANWNMYVNGSYSMFLGRIVEMVFIIPSFMLLQFYLEKQKTNYLIASLFLFFISVGLSHWFFFFTPLYLIYPIAYSFFTNNNWRQHLKFILVGLSFAGVSLLFWFFQEITYPGWGGRDWTFTEFVSDPSEYQYPEKMAQQIVYLSSYPLLLKPLFNPSLLNTPPLQYYPDLKDISKITPYVLVFYIVAIFIIHFRLPNLRALLWTLVVSILIGFFLNAFMNRYDILNNANPNRYLYVGAMLLMIFWSILIKAVFGKGKKLMLAGIVISAFFYVANVWLIQEHFKRHYVWEIPTTRLYDHIITETDMLPDNSLIITKFEQSGNVEAIFLTEYLGKGKVTFIDDHSVKIDELAKKSSVVIKMVYDEQCKCIIEEKLK